MRRSALLATGVIGLATLTFTLSRQAWAASATVRLPPPKLKGELSVEEALAKRRSVRSYSPEPITLQQVAQLLWAGQGITDTLKGFRASPSAGATYPLEVFLVAGKVEGLEPGVYRYRPRDHVLILHQSQDLRVALDRASLDQGMVREAPATLVLAAVPSRTTRRYRERGIRYVHIEVGHVGQNIYLQAQALGLATVAIGAFYDSQVKRVLRISEEPLYLMPVGRPGKAIRY